MQLVMVEWVTLEMLFTSNIDGVEPTEENVRNDTYPITRYLHFFTTKSPGG